MLELTKNSIRGYMRFLAKDAFVYGIAGAIGKACSLLTFPLLTRFFSVADYGLIDMFTTAALLLSTVLTFGMDAAAGRFFHEETNLGYRRQVVSQSICFLGLVLITILPILMLVQEYTVLNLGVSSEYTSLMKFLLLQAPFYVLLNFSTTLLKWTLRRNAFLVLTLGSTLTLTLCLVCGIIWFNITMVGVFLTYILTYALFSMAGLWFIRDWLEWPSGLGRLREMVPFALPFGVVCILGALLPFLERSLVRSLLGVEDLGLFAVGARVASLLVLPINAFQTAWAPFALAISKHDNADRAFQIVLIGFCISCSCAVLGLSAVADPVVTLFGSSRYENAGTVVFALGMAQAINAIGGITEMGVILSKKSYLKLYSYVAMVFVAAFTIPILTSAFGIAGAAWGSLAAVASRIVIETWLSQRAYPIRWNLHSVGIIVALTVGIGIVHQISYGHIRAAGISPVPLIGVVLLAVLAWRMVLAAEDRSRLRRLVRFW